MVASDRVTRLVFRGATFAFSDTPELRHWAVNWQEGSRTLEDPGALSVAEILARDAADDPSLDLVDAITTYEVLLDYLDRQVRYRAAILWTERSETGDPLLRIVDPVVVNLADVVHESRPLLTDRELADAMGLNEWRSAVGREVIVDDSEAEVFTPGTPGIHDIFVEGVHLPGTPVDLVPDPAPGDTSNLIPGDPCGGPECSASTLTATVFNQVIAGTQDHLFGSHKFGSRIDVKCDCSPICTSTATTIIDPTCTDSGVSHTWTHSPRDAHDFRVGFSGDGVTSPARTKGIHVCKIFQCAGGNCQFGLTLTWGGQTWGVTVTPPNAQSWGYRVETEWSVCPACVLLPGSPPAPQPPPPPA